MVISSDSPNKSVSLEPLMSGCWIIGVSLQLDSSFSASMCPCRNCASEDFNSYFIVIVGLRYYPRLFLSRNHCLNQGFKPRWGLNVQEFTSKLNEVVLPSSTLSVDLCWGTREHGLGN